MKNILLLVVIAGLVFTCTPKEESQVNQDEEVKSEVSEASMIPQISIDNFDMEAGNYVDQEVLISGLVDHVCKHGGKKLRLVTDGNKSIHVESETRFDDALVGNEISVNGIVRELRIDEAYCLKMEEDNISSHKEGETNDEAYEHKLAQIKSYRDSMATAEVDHLSFYSLEFVSLEKKEEAPVVEETE